MCSHTQKRSASRYRILVRYTHQLRGWENVSTVQSRCRRAMRLCEYSSFLDRGMQNFTLFAGNYHDM